jgi:hypothetical protein
MRQLVNRLAATIRRQWSLGGRVARPQPRRSQRLQLENLEDRLTPSTFTVTTAVGDSSVVGSLPWAVQQANADQSHGNVAINFSAALNGQSIQLSKTLELNNPTSGESITISAPTSGYVALLGGGSKSSFSVLKVDAGTTATLQRIYIENGHNTGGGGIENEGSLTLNYCGVMYCSADATGGGIDNYGSMWLNNMYMASNSVGLDGGAVYNDGQLTVNDGAFWHGTASGGFSTNLNGYGGGFYNDAAGKLTLNGADIENNTATYGGGVYNLGTATAAQMSGGPASYFWHNSASQNGGGIYNLGSMVVSASYVECNTAGLDGGGAYSVNQLNLYGDVVEWNTAGRNGGGVCCPYMYPYSSVLVAFSCTIADNTANNGSGGGIYCPTGQLWLWFSTVTANSAQYGYGGGVYGNGSAESLYGNNISGNSAFLYPDLY